MTEQAKRWLKIALAVPAGAAAIYGTFTFLDRIIRMPERMDQHVTLSRAVHDSAQKVAAELHEHALDQEKLLEGMVRGECIENPKANLARQGLLVKCRALGIER